MPELILVFVHGYSVTDFGTYGELPLRLRTEATARGFNLRTADIFLGRYISFNDQVKLSDAASALEFAVQQQIPKNTRFVCITHSTGGPLLRTWWQEFYFKTSSICPMSHLVMLAPANHGSALAQLGKSKLSRVRSWFDGIEAGQGILDWLELGSNGSWNLNKDWIFHGKKQMEVTGVFPFVITGQDIDRKLYDHINSYTGELGSDGAVRVASASVNSRYLKLEQGQPLTRNGKTLAEELVVSDFGEATPTPLRVVKNKSHSGEQMGIMRSVKRETTDFGSAETVDTIFRCIAVTSQKEHAELVRKFHDETIRVQEESKIELEIKPLRKKLYIHDRYSMIIFRVQDMEGNLIPDFDLILTGENDDPDLLPTGFFGDRQINKLNKNTITYYINYDVMTGCAPVIDPDHEVVRKSLKGIEELGLTVLARPIDGFVRYLPCKIRASKELFNKIIQPNSTTMIDIYLRRLVSDQVFRFEKNELDTVVLDFKNIKPGEGLVS